MDDELLEVWCSAAQEVTPPRGKRGKKCVRAPCLFVRLVLLLAPVILVDMSDNLHNVALLGAGIFAKTAVSASACSVIGASARGSSPGEWGMPRH